jgi:hypothetical protein
VPKIGLCVCCHQGVSEQAVTCPHCGQPNPYAANIEPGAIFKANVIRIYPHGRTVYVELPHGISGALYTDDFQRFKVGDTLVVRIRNLWVEQNNSLVCIELV